MRKIVDLSQVRPGVRAIMVALSAATLLASVTTSATADDRAIAQPDHQIHVYSGPRPAGLPAPAKSDGAAKVSDAYLGRFYIVNEFTINGIAYCLDAWYSYGGGNGNPVGLYQCNGGITEQWDVYDNGCGCFYWLSIRNARTGRSLDYPASSGGANGWQYETWDYYPSTGQQFWPFWHSDTSDYEISVVLGGGANVMDAFQSDGGGNGNRVGNWAITGHPLQRWVFVLA